MTARRAVHFDLIGGAAGDMLLAALIDAGAPLDGVREGLAPLEVEFELRSEPAVTGYLAARRVEVRPGPGPEPHRHLADVLAILAPLPGPAREKAEAVFRRLAEAEAGVHGTSVEAVHFHEVGAVDAIVDVAGVCLALELLGVERVTCSPFPLGTGATRAAHGALPLPAPAVLRLLEGLPVAGRAVGRELVTPTGAALLATLAADVGPYPALRLLRAGYGAGTREAAAGEPPNVVRAVLGELPEVAAPAPGAVLVLEANLDDQSPELTAHLQATLLEAGALDAFLTPVLMKKGRPAVVVTAVCAPEAAGPVEDVLLRESSTLGVRRRREERTVLPRESARVETRWGPVALKVAVRPDGRRTAAPEYEDCARLARERGVPLAEVYRAALAAWAGAGP